MERVELRVDHVEHGEGGQGVAAADESLRVTKILLVASLLLVNREMPVVTLPVSMNCRRPPPAGGVIDHRR